MINAKPTSVVPDLRYALASLALLTASATGQDCAGWVKRAPDDAPGETPFQAMVYDSVRGRCVLFDGNLDQKIRETWEWDGLSWILRTTEGPDSLGQHAMVFDSARAVTVLFGGVSVINGDAVLLDQTWVWDGALWQNVANGATERAFHAMAYDSDRGVTVLFGGSNPEGNHLGDTWEWDGQQWTKREVDGPDPTLFHVMAYDSARKVTVFLGGAFSETWEWDGEVWQQIPVQPPPVSGSMVYDSDRQVCVIYGSQQTWQYDGQSWKKLNTPVKPISTFGPMAYDSARRAVVLFTREGETWEYLCDPACPPDLDGNGILDVFDFLAFVNAFNAGADTADCDESGALDLFDFLCFVNAFNAGC